MIKFASCSPGSASLLLIQKKLYELSLLSRKEREQRVQAFMDAEATMIAALDMLKESFTDDPTQHPDYSREVVCITWKFIKSAKMLQPTVGDYICLLLLFD